MDNSLKAIAMYLPQYHQVEENSKWWGEGFTDWRAMERAKSLYKGHKQPKRPLNGNTYDLMNKSTMLWQAELMKKYEIYGLCFYHYWFKEGKKILEKPAENLLKWKDIKMPFCFCWANESWVCSWSNVSNQNVWASSFEKNEKREGNGVLLEQKYGTEEAWREHFAYLLPFFHDERYIKIENKPVFLIYKPTDILCLTEMIDLWNELAKKDGFSGIYTIGANCDNESKKILDAELTQEPMATIRRSFSERFASKIPEIARAVFYDDIWKNSLEYMGGNGKTYWGGFSNYDDTPRRGNAGTVVYEDSAEKFAVYLTELYAKNAAEENEFVFINAWNEWGEGMYLEPDEENKFKYLEAVQYAQKNYQDKVEKYKERKIEYLEKFQVINKIQQEKNRYETEWKILDRWMCLRDEGKKIHSFFKKNGYHKIAVYGYGAFGKHFLKEMEETDVEIVYVIDRNAAGLNIDISAFTPDVELPEVDLVVVTTVHIYRDIYYLLKSKGMKHIISLGRIIYEC